MLKQLKLERRLFREVDRTVLFSTILIVLYGILNIYLCTKGEYGTSFAKKQFLWLIISLVALYVCIAVDYSTIILIVERIFNY